MATVYYAKWVLLPDFSLLENGGVAVEENRIVSVGTRGRIRRSRGDRLVNLGNCLLMPGLINMHTHLEEGAIRGMRRSNDETFGTWLMKQRSRLKQASPQALQHTVRLGIRESLANGTTTIVDSSSSGASATVLSQEPIRSWVINELYAEDDSQDFGAQEQAGIMLDALPDSVGKGVGPYSIFSHSPQSIKAISDTAVQKKALFALHCAESAEELQAFSEKAGDLYFYITRRRVWSYNDAKLGSLDFAIRENIIPNRAICFHCNYATGQELSLLCAKQVCIVHCHQYNQQLGHKSFPLDVAINRRVRLTLGTENSSLDSMDLFDELHAVKSEYPHLRAADLLPWVTSVPATALQMGQKLGQIKEGFFADLIALAVPHDPHGDLVEDILIEKPEIRVVIVNGEEVIMDLVS